MKVILFDLDGTLTDSAPGITACVQYALEKMGKSEEDKDKLRSFVGPPLKDQFMAQYGFTEKEAVDAVRYYRERYVKTGMYENALYPGIEELLAYLKDRGCVLAVASSKPEIYVREILEHFCLTGYFREIVGADMEGKRDAKADVIEEALKRLGMQNSRQDVVMVGDRSYDILGAHECGIQCVGVSYGYGSMDELIKAGVTYVADSVEELEILATNEEQDDVQMEIKSIDVTELSKAQERKQRKEARKRKKKKEETEEEYPIKESVPHKIWRIIYPPLIHFGISNLVSVVVTMALVFIGMLILGIQTREDLVTLAEQQVLAITGLGGLVSLPFLYHFVQADKERRASGRYALRSVPAARVSGQMILGTLCMGIGLCQVLNDLLTYSQLDKVFTYYSEVESQVFTGQSVLMILVVTVIIAPIAEEMTFRGLVQLRIRDYIGPVPAILISAVAFGLYHGNMIQFIYAGVLGIFFAYVMEKSQSLVVPIVGHMAANFWSTLGIAVMAVLIQSAGLPDWSVDIVMALVFVGGLSLVLTEGKKKPAAKAETEKPAPQAEEPVSEIPPVDMPVADNVETAEIETPEVAAEETEATDSPEPEETEAVVEAPETEAEPEAVEVPETEAVEAPKAEETTETTETPETEETSETE